MVPVLLVPVGMALLAGAAAVVKGRRDKAETSPAVIAQRKVIYETAIGAVDSNTAIKDPEKLRALAKAFRGEGAIAEADMLDKRAALRELPPEIVEARRVAFRKLMECTDPGRVLAAAAVFENEGATGAAENLRKYAAGLTAAEETTDGQS